MIARRTIAVSTTSLLIAITLYCFIYVRSYSHRNIRAGLDSSIGDFSQSILLNQPLHPQDHATRPARTHNVQFNITSGYRRPDGVQKRVYLINGEFPGPTIEARSGDEFVIEVNNFLDSDEGVAIHWHGLSMRGANAMDGVPGLTQVAIANSESFAYRFTIDENQSGTFWYHAHSALQRADGLYGALIVHKATESLSLESHEFEYDGESALLIGDWYHRPATDILEWYRDWTNFGAEPAPDSLLINGKGAFNCTMAVPARPLDCVAISQPVLDLRCNRTRLRIINVGALVGLTLSFEGYEMTVFRIDGGNQVEASNAVDSIGILYPGERVDVILTRIHVTDSSGDRMIVELDDENMRFMNLALDPIQRFPILSTTKRAMRGPSSMAVDTRYYDLSRVPGLLQSAEVPAVVDQFVLLYTKIEILAEFDNRPKGFINRTSWVSPDPISKPMIDHGRTQWDGQPFVPHLQSGANKWVDIVINNFDDKGHPFHLHGYDFYVVSRHHANLGSYVGYNPFDVESKPPGGPMNIQNPAKKDTVFVPPMGYVVLRFRADNDGLWLFHCHLLWHEQVGMAMAFEVR